ncbi:hypothetical protein ZIOFF_072820 [Zingiber officinale]|uniref:Uncharacterized protein n=1 Tax=Zingiber officinale TaxID=94328 RepID=A0A8J5C317_ZINOF|nr:hypothetical protein ZIOFF_072820 [Zingiber officinale]
MACINMQLSADRQALCGVPAAAAPPPMSPRVSFSSDFAVEPPPPRAAVRPPPPDPNFEFAVGGGNSTIDADQLFFKGRLLPLKDSRHGQRPRAVTTLREELLSPTAGSGDWPERPLRGSAIKWKELLGLKKPHCSFAPVPAPGKKQSDKSEEGHLNPTQVLFLPTPPSILAPQHQFIPRKTKETH